MAFWTSVLRFLALFQALPVIALARHHQGHSYGHSHKSHSHPETLEKRRATIPAGARSNILLDDESCTARTGYVSQIFDNVLTICTTAQSAIDIINNSMGKQRSKLTSDEKAKIDVFMSLYGAFENDDLSAVYNAKNKLDQVKGFLDNMAGGLSGDTFNIHFFCDDSQWEYVEEDEDGEHSYKIKGDPDSEETIMEYGICEHEDNKDLMAFQADSKSKKKDYLTVCPYGWNEWEGRHITQTRAESLSELLGESLTEILASAPEVSILHELTHTTSFFGEEGILIDVENDAKEEVYEFDPCFDLAQADKDQTDMSKVRALKNADNFAYFCTALYLRQCNWRNGLCQNPDKVE